MDGNTNTARGNSRFAQVPVLVKFLCTAIGALAGGIGVYEFFFKPSGSGPEMVRISHFGSEPSTIRAGEAAKLSWSVENATSITLNLGEVRLDGEPVLAESRSNRVGRVETEEVSVASVGERLVRPESDTSYTLIASGPGGEKRATTEIEVAELPLAEKVEKETLRAKPLPGDAILSFSHSSNVGRSFTFDVRYELNATRLSTDRVFIGGNFVDKTGRRLGGYAPKECLDSSGTIGLEVSVGADLTSAKGLIFYVYHANEGPFFAKFFQRYYEFSRYD